MKLGVNIDHIATLRQAREVRYPDPAAAAVTCEYAGADSLVAHLREDRRHIQERDVFLIKEVIKIPFNLEMAVQKEIVDIACRLVPAQATLVPEKRRELTTEGGLDLISCYDRVARTVERLSRAGITVSLFIDPLLKQIVQAQRLGVSHVEFNTGRYSEAKTEKSLARELAKIERAIAAARQKNLTVACGHGLDYENVQAVALLPGLSELNIGHSIISRAVFTGLPAAVEEMISLIQTRSRGKKA